MSLNPSEISELIKSRIESLDDTAEIHNQGTIVSVSDGICRIRGLSNAMQGEMLEFPGNTYGLALNLERHFVGAVILGEYEHIRRIGASNRWERSRQRQTDSPYRKNRSGRYCTSIRFPADANRTQGN